MKHLLCLLALLPALHAPIGRGVRLVVMTPPGEHTTNDEVASAVSAVTAAANFWHSRAPSPVDLHLVSVEVVSIPVDPYHGDPTPWTGPYLVDQNPMLTVIVLDNSDTYSRFEDGATGWAQEWYGLAVSVEVGMPEPNGLAATMAHEMGHALFGLKDLYGGPCQTDIMCNPVTAFNTPSIGCASLDAMGAPCRRMWVPVVQFGG